MDVFVKNSAKATSVGNFSLNTVVSIGKEFELYVSGLLALRGTTLLTLSEPCN